MVFRVISLILILAGAVVMAITAWRYYTLVRRNRRDSYSRQNKGRGVEALSLCVMVFFIIGFGVGAADVIRRDVEPIYLFVALVFFVGALFIAALVQAQFSMEDNLRDKTMEVMRGFVNSIEMKDPYTQGHSWHVYHIIRVFYPKLPQEMRSRVNETKLLDAALLHDIGKMAVSNDILNKKGPLTDDEWAEIKTHPRQGERMLSNTCFSEISDWVLYHHERMDGSGYYGLSAEEIPLEAKIIALADTYSAMTTDREYRPKRSHNDALLILQEVAGTQLDGELVEYFCTVEQSEMDELIGLLKEELATRVI